MKTRKLITVVTTCGIAALAGCGGGGGIDTSPAPATEVQSLGLLKPAASDAELADSMRKGLADAGYTSSSGPPLALMAELESGALEGDGAAGGGYSTTNLQEAGVDEADTVKYDGDTLYVLDLSGSYLRDPGLDELAGISEAPQSITGVVRVLHTNPAGPGTQEVAQIDFDSENYNGALYLAGSDARKQLVYVGEDNNLYHWALFALDYYWLNQTTRIYAWDVSDPGAPVKNWSMLLDGRLLTSRRIDNMLYLVTRFTPHIDGLVAYPASEEEVSANATLIDDTPLQDLLPKVRRDGGEPRELLASTDCYLPNEDYQGIAPPRPSASLVTVTAIDLEAPDRISSICLDSFASGFYASRDNLYVTSNMGDDTTLIHKFSFGGGALEYRGSGEVPGYLGTGSPSFLMSESGDDLRVVSSNWAEESFPLPVDDSGPASAGAAPAAEQDYGRHHLSILRENAGETRLETIAQLPNSERPTPIGKPGENIYAARFIGDRAYLVTFQVIDPLYVLDLSDPQAPRIGGELELPGFSTLLQPLGDELLLGVGYSVVADNGTPVPQGVKVALFNVGDIENPVELGSEVIGQRGSYSPAFDDYHALTVLQADSGVFRVALPIDRHDVVPEGFSEENPWLGYLWSDSGLYEFEADPAAGSLRQVGAIVTEQRSENQLAPSYGLQGSRSVLHDDAVFFVQPPLVVSKTWGE